MVVVGVKATVLRAALTAVEVSGCDWVAPALVRALAVAVAAVTAAASAGKGRARRW